MSLSKRRYKIFVVVLLVLLAISQGKPANAGNNIWTSIGPDSIAVYVHSLVIDPVTTSTLYALTRGGVFRSTNAGDSWTNIDNNLFTQGLNTLPEVSVLAIDPAVHTTLYLMSSNGFYKSTNSGGTWTKWSTSAEGFTSLVIAPRTPATMYGAVAGKEGWLGGRLLKSTNGGKDWSTAMHGLVSGEIRALAVDPLAPSTLYIGLYQGGVFKSTDGGANWFQAPQDKADHTNFWDNKQILDLAVDQAAPTILYAATEQDGLFKSVDGGENWASLGLPLGRSPISISIDPVTHTTLYANTGDNCLFKSVNSGGDWILVNQGSIDNYRLQLRVDPQNPATLYGLAYQGLFKSTNGGQDWSEASTGLVDANVRTITVDPVTPSTLYVGGMMSGVFKSTNRGASWSQMNEGLGSAPVVDHIAIDPLTPSILYAVSGQVYKSTNGGGSWTKMSDNMAEQDMILDLAINPLAPSTLYALARSGILYKTTNGGENWTAYNIGLVYGGPNVLVIDPLTPTTLYVGTNANGVRKSTDGGQTWTQTGLPAYTSGVYALAIDPKTPTTLYADVYIELNSPKNGIYKSVNGGVNWTQINADMQCVAALVVDPLAPTTLYASIGGVFKSTDGGRNWTTLNSGLPYSIINALAVDPLVPGTVYAGTYATGVYKMQNNPLAVNYSSGAPGSNFTLQGSQFTPNSTAAIRVNGRTLGNVPVDSQGSFTFILQTGPEIDEGLYSVKAITPKDQSDARFFIRAGAPLHPHEGNAPILTVPDGIAYRQVYLPVVAR